MKPNTIFLKRYKLKKQINREFLVSIGSRVISEVMCEDRYFFNKGKDTNSYTKIRKEGELDEKIISTKQLEIEKDLIKEKITYKIITKEEKPLKEIAHIHKKRTTAILGPVIIHIDKIEGFGEYIEFIVMKEKDILAIDKVKDKFLDYIDKKAIIKSYLEIFIKSQDSKSIFSHKICETIGKFSFGISGGVLTTLGVMMGLLSATESKIAVIGGIVSVAIADSLSDSISMYSSKKAERGTTQKSAITSAVNVFLGKFVFTLTFIVPFLLFSFFTAIIINIIWGLLLIILVNLIIAITQEENKLETITKNTAIAIVVVVLSYLVGLLINLIFKP